MFLPSPLPPKKKEIDSSSVAGGRKFLKQEVGTNTREDDLNKWNFQSTFGTLKIHSNLNLQHFTDDDIFL